MSMSMQSNNHLLYKPVFLLLHGAHRNFQWQVQTALPFLHAFFVLKWVSFLIFLGGNTLGFLGLCNLVDESKYIYVMW